MILEEPLVIEEVIESLRSLNNGKAAGSDGLPIEVYKVLQRKLAPVLLETYKEILRDGKMHLSGRRGIITLLEKRRKESSISSDLETFKFIKL